MSLVRILLLLVGATILSACASVEQGPRGAVAVPIAAPADPPTAFPVAVKIEPVTFTVHFDFASANIRASAMQILYGAAQKAKRAKPGIVRIRGFTDASGKRDFNLKLARSRAEAVAGQLRKLGIEARIEIVAAEIISAQAGKSKKDPANRKVEVTFDEFPAIVATTAVDEQAAPSPDMDAPSGRSFFSAPSWLFAMPSPHSMNAAMTWNVARQRSLNLHLS